MVLMWLAHQLRHLWWWVRGVNAETCTMRCGRCGHNGRIHLWVGGCRCYMPAVADQWSRRR
jgi:hypothetical protein